MGFWAVLSFVISSQVGSGIFLFPAKMASLGGVGLFAWLLTGLGALLLAFIFSRLCELYPETGGPHAYVAHVFGPRAGFYVAWTYWILAWLGIVPTLNILAGAFFLALGADAGPFSFFLVEAFVLLGVTLLNLRGVQASGRWEVFMTLLKMVPLILFPIFGFFFLKPHHFVPTTELPWHEILSKATLITFWGFLGVESATAPAGSVENPRKTIPRALIAGTLLVVLLYTLNTTAVMGLVPPDVLQQASCPHGIALNVLLGPQGSRWISLLIVIVCLGALNAWLLICSQVAKGAAEDGFFPKFFQRQNRFEAPFWGLFVSSGLCCLVLLGLLNHSLADQISFVVDVSVAAYLGIYLLCVAVFLKKLYEGKFKSWGRASWMVGIGAFVFCFWPLWGASLEVILWAFFIPLVGIPFEKLFRRKIPSRKNHS
jgi:APA family basic amino acid/polyamine antiporter